MFRNGLSLTALQLFSYAVPFLLLPYLSRTLGVAGFGEVALVWAIGAYIQIFADFGFYVYGAKEAAVHRDDNAELSRLWSSALLIKSGLLAISFLMMLLAAFLSGSSISLFAFMWVALAAQVLAPSWFFQGLEKGFLLLVFALSAQVAGAVLTVFTVKSPDDLVFVAASQAFAWVAVSFLANIFVAKKYSLILSIPRPEYLKKTVSEAYHLFVANVAISFYVNLPSLALGVFSTKNELAVFTAAQKIVFALQGLFTPVSSAVFPRSSRLAKENGVGHTSFVARFWLLSIACFFVFGSFLFMFSDEIVSLAFGAEFSKSGEILKIMAFGPMFVAASIVASNHYVIPIGKAPKLKKIYISVAIAGSVASVFLCGFFGAVGGAYLYLAVEVAVCGWLGFAALSMRQKT